MISIVLPIYNVAPYVAQCLDSITLQTYRNFEVIAVDDCSTDASMSIVEAYAPKLPLRIVRHEHNRGLSAARNTGVSVAQGEYILFVDSDDTLASDCLQVLYNEALRTDADVVVGNIDTFGENGNFVPRLHCTEPQLLIGTDMVLRNHLRGDGYVMAWNKLLKRNFLLQKQIAFDEGLLHEDNPWSLRVACRAQSMALLPNITYHYRLRKGSLQMGDDFSKHFEAYCSILPMLATEIEHSAHCKTDLIGWLESQKALFFLQTKKMGTKTQLAQIYDVIRTTLPQYKFDKFFIHYWLPKQLGQRLYDHLCGVWLI